MAKNKLQKQCDNLVKAWQKQAKADFWPIIQDVNKKLYQEAKEMFYSFIDQFYSYKTKSYVRHDQPGPGTGKGVNLYFATQIKMIAGKRPKLVVAFDASDMEGGYQYDDKETVLDMVMGGVRFPNERAMYWKGSYTGHYFSYSGSPEGAFGLFNDTFDSIAAQLFYPQWRLAGY